MLADATQFFNATGMALALAALVAGLARGFSGFGGAAIFMPLASALIGPVIASPTLLVIDAVLALGMIPNAWRLARRDIVLRLLMGAAIGIPVGALALKFGDVLTLRWVIALTALTFALIMASGFSFKGRAHPAGDVATGIVSGFFGGVAQLSGLPVVTYLSARSMEPAILRGTLVILFAAMTVMAISTYAMAGIFSGGVLGGMAVAGPAYGAGILIGSRFFDLASAKTFRRISLSLIIIAAVTSLPVLDALVRP